MKWGKPTITWFCCREMKQGLCKYQLWEGQSFNPSQVEVASFSPHWWIGAGFGGRTSRRKRRSPTSIGYTKLTCTSCTLPEILLCFSKALIDQHTSRLMEGHRRMGYFRLSDFAVRNFPPTFKTSWTLNSNSVGSSGIWTWDISHPKRESYP